jgi:hypothetical protein
MAGSISSPMASICFLGSFGREMDTSSEPFIRRLCERLADIVSIQSIYNVILKP